MKLSIRRVIIIGLVWMIPIIGSAHWLPRSETFVGGVGPGCTLSYVASVYGQPAEKRWFNSDGMRGVTYVYSPYFSITGRVWHTYQTPEGDLPVVGYSLTTSFLATPSGLTVGIPITTVTGMYGTASQVITNRNGEKVYIYDMSPMESMVFTVNSQKVITKIYYGTDW